MARVVNQNRRAGRDVRTRGVDFERGDFARRRSNQAAYEVHSARHSRQRGGRVPTRARDCQRGGPRLRRRPRARRGRGGSGATDSSAHASARRRARAARVERGGAVNAGRDSARRLPRSRRAIGSRRRGGDLRRAPASVGECRANVARVAPKDVDADHAPTRGALVIPRRATSGRACRRV